MASKKSEKKAPETLWQENSEMVENFLTGENSASSKPIYLRNLFQYAFAYFFRKLRRIDAGEASRAETFFGKGHGTKHAFETQVLETIHADEILNPFDLALGSNKFLFRWEVNAVETRVAKRRTAHSHMHLFSACLAYRLHPNA